VYTPCLSGPLTRQRSSAKSGDLATNGVHQLAGAKSMLSYGLQPQKPRQSGIFASLQQASALQILFPLFFICQASFAMLDLQLLFLPHHFISSPQGKRVSSPLWGEDQGEGHFPFSFSSLPPHPLSLSPKGRGNEVSSLIPLLFPLYKRGIRNLEKSPAPRQKASATRINAIKITLKV
jgi:hypothetical protein